MTLVPSDVSGVVPSARVYVGVDTGTEPIFRDLNDDSVDLKNGEKSKWWINSQLKGEKFERWK
jgi:hypothetical protein